MEGTQSSRGGRQSRSTTKREFMVEVWVSLGQPAVGEAELREIQLAVRNQFGPGVDESPAAIARVLADAGAELRHPEVIEFDAEWRDAKIENGSRELVGLGDLLLGGTLRFDKAEGLIKRLEEARQNSEGAGDRNLLKRLRSLAISSRQNAEVLAGDRKLNSRERDEQAEIAEWLKVWLQTPALFADWLELRRRSAEFQKKFSGGEEF
jgi:hypothetical protein